MSASTFVSVTTWGSILIMIYGILFKVFDNNFTTWFIFAFLCLTGIFVVLGNLAEKYKK